MVTPARDGSCIRAPFVGGCPAQYTPPHTQDPLSQKKGGLETLHDFGLLNHCQTDSIQSARPQVQQPLQTDCVAVLLRT